MDKITIHGGKPLRGKIPIGGAKNSALPLMTACLLTEEEVVLSNLPHLADIATMAHLLVQHGVKLNIDACSDIKGGHTGRVLSICAGNITNFTAPYDIVRKMRASVLVLGPLLARFGHARVSLPGGCAIGTRPIDLHLDALEKMGTTIVLDEGYIEAKVNGKLKGAHIKFPKVSVGATENILMAATLAEGTTVMENAAMEPEITDLAQCLISMGADISGVGTSTLTIKGKDKLHKTSYAVIADRIEAGSYAVAAAITDGEVELLGVTADIMQATIDKLAEAGVSVTETKNGLLVKRKGKDILPIVADTQPYPGLATDMQAQFMALAAVAKGESRISETIFENRFMHVPELIRMGADIKVDGHTCIITGVDKLKGAPVMATDLRASVSLVLAALVAEGATVINRVYHIDRGYECVEEKLASCGADIKRTKA